MSGNNPNTNVSSGAVTAAVLTIPDIQTRFDAGLVSMNTEVVSRFVDDMVNQEINKRSQIVAKAFELYNLNKKELNNIRATSPGFEQDGTTALPAIFTQDQISKRRKLTQKIGDIEAAFAKAMDATNPNYDALIKIVNS